MNKLNKTKNNTKKKIMALIHLFNYEKDLRNSNIDNKAKKTKCYLIDKSCFEKYKSFYE